MRLRRVVSVLPPGIVELASVPSSSMLLAILLASILLASSLLAAGCRPVIRPSIGGRPIVIRVDGRDISRATNVLTVREALAEADVTIDADDRVEPDLWVEVQEGMTIRVIRVQEETIVEREVLPYREQTIKSEALAVGETKFLQAGKNGQVEVTYRLQFEDGVEVSRGVLRRVVVQEPLNQITVAGVEGIVDSVEVRGTIAYLNGGNAWVMRGASGGRRPVTSEGNLDGRVFTLSPDGAYLLYSVPTATVEYDGTFNDLYLLNVALADETPRQLPIQDVLWADWAPCGQKEAPDGAALDSERTPCAQIAYSTGVKSGPPGWRANNDLWLASLLDDRGQAVRPEPRRLLGPQSSGVYSWWGSRYAWSPDGAKIAYARPDQVGWIELRTGRVFPLAPYPPQAPPGSAQGDQVWVPAPTWSPDSRFLACTIHGEEPGRPAEESRVFEVWVLDLNQSIRARMTRSVGMWSAPRWSPAVGGESQIAYAEANTPSSSYESRYTLQVMDRDGSNKRRIFPGEDQAWMTRPVVYDWSPDGSQVVVLYLGDVYLVDVADGQVLQLTGDGQCTRVDWAE
jgi:hypothetical protein